MNCISILFNYTILKYKICITTSLNIFKWEYIFFNLYFGKREIFYALTKILLIISFINLTVKMKVQR